MKHFYLSFFLFTSFLVTFSQTQIGEDIEGWYEGQQYGADVCLSHDGNVLAVLGTEYSASGYFHVYHDVAGRWEKLGVTEEGTNFEGLRSGIIALASDGKTFAHGWGSVRVYNFANGIWKQIGNNITNEDSGYGYGNMDLSSDGKIIIIGTLTYVEYDSSKTSGPPPPLYRGRAEVFSYESGNWQQIGEDLVGVSDNERFGNDVSISSDGSRVAIASWYDTRVYQNIDGTWTLMGSPIPGAEHMGKKVGFSADGTILAIGEGDYTGEFIQQGRVKVFEYIEGNWVQIGNTILGERSYERTGWDISLSESGKTLAVGNQGVTQDVSSTQTTRLYQLEGENWVQQGSTIFGDPREDYSGMTLSLAGDASRIAVGNEYHDGIAPDAGKVKVFNLEGVVNDDNNTLALTKRDLDDIRLYPNPTSSTINISLPTNLQLKTVELYTSLGQIILSGTEPTINVSNLTSGTYILKIHSDKGTINKKLIVN